MPDAFTNLASTPPNEELAGPALPIRPVGRAERIAAIDVLRGFALLGILLTNIDDFGTTETAHDIPLGTPVDSFHGPHAHLNLLVFAFKWLFIEGKMRGLFSMLFGAGIILLTGRAEKRNPAARLAPVYFRRNLLLTLFGLLHGLFLWAGDILFDYGAAALLFLYPARKLKAKTLIFTGLLLSLTLGTASISVISQAAFDLPLSQEAQAVSQRLQSHGSVTPADLQIEKRWQARLAAKKVTPEKIRTNLAEGRAGYRQHVKSSAEQYFGFGILRHVVALFDIPSVMLLGMGLCKAGFLTGESSTALYLWTVFLGFALSLPLCLFGILHSYADGFFFLTVDRWLVLPYDLTRDAEMLALAALVMLLVRFSIFRAPQRWLAAVGKTALSNYIGTSLLCQFIFLWSPFKLFGKLEYFQLMYVVFAVWAVNLLGSTFWLRYFEYGPLEWLWRSLTYLRLQPTRLRPALLP